VIALPESLRFDGRICPRTIWDVCDSVCHSENRFYPLAKRGGLNLANSLDADLHVGLHLQSNPTIAAGRAGLAAPSFL
jgi:hypothetical protein